MKAVKLTLALTLLGAATLANAAYWSRTNYGPVSSYSGTRLGGWALSGSNWNHYVFYGEKQACQRGSTSCTHSYAKATNFNWTWGVSLSTDFTLIPDVWSVNIGGQYSQNRGWTTTSTYSVTVGPGKMSQYAEYVPRRYGNVTVYGARVATGNTRRVCPTMGPLGTCWSGWKDEWEYNDDPNKKVALIKGWKNTSNPIHTYIITNL